MPKRFLTVSERGLTDGSRSLFLNPEQNLAIASSLAYRDMLRASLVKQAISNTRLLAELATMCAKEAPEYDYEFARLLSCYTDAAVFDLKEGRWL